MSRVRQRVDGAAAFLLHSYPYSETSLILEAFTRGHGRMAILARGARRPRSALRSVLLTFQPLELGWFGGGEIKTLAKAEWQGGIPFLQGSALLLGYYLNELLLKLLPREDPHTPLFDAYADAIGALASQKTDDARATIELRRFEIALLRELGYGLVLEHDIEGAPIQAAQTYHYQLERGLLPASDEGIGLRISGQTVIDLARDTYDHPRTLQEAKQLMRHLLNHYLPGHALQTRRVFMALQDL